MNQTAVKSNTRHQLQQELFSARRTEKDGNDSKPGIPSFDISRIPVSRGEAAIVQPKLRINNPGDRYEQEADRIADQIMQMPDQGVQRKCASCEQEEEEELQMKPLSEQITPLVQRKCDKCEEEDEELQMKAFGTERRVAGLALSEEIKQTRGNGHRLDNSTARFMSSRLGRDLSDVRIHTGGKAARMNQEINARAFTVGKDIYFNRGMYAPGSSEGKRLLAHELTHVIQQAEPEPVNGFNDTLSGDVYQKQISDISSNGTLLQRDCAEDKRKCRNSLNWSDGGHWQGLGPEPDCNCDSRFSDAQAACNNRLNWSDGGHWIGSGAEPNCNLRQSGESRFTLTYLFPSNECVQRYNSGRSRISTRVSTGAGLAIGTVAAIAGGNPVPGIIAGAAANELIGAIPQTPIGVGYRWVRVFIARYERSAHPWGVNNLMMGVESSVYNERNELVEGFTYSKSIPDREMVRIGPLIVSQGNGARTISCPRANVLSY